MVCCSVKSCKNYSGNVKNRNISFFSFPKDQLVAKRWSKACNITHNPDKRRFVCSIHFKPTDYKPKPDYLRNCVDYSPKRLRKILPTAVPSLNLERPPLNEPVKINYLAKDYVPKDDIKLCLRAIQHDHDAYIRRDGNVNVVWSDKVPIKQEQDSKKCNVPEVQCNTNNIPITSVKQEEKNDKDLVVMPSIQYKLNDTPIHINYSNGNVIEDEDIKNLISIKETACENVYNIVPLNNVKTANVHTQTENNVLKNVKLVPLTMVPDNMKSASTSNKQTSDLVLVESLKKENMRLRKKIHAIDKANRANFKRQVRERLKSTFSPAQIEKIMNPHKDRIKWTNQDIMSAVQLRDISMQAYKFLRKNNYPLPGLSTLRKWVFKEKGIKEINDSLT